MKKKLFNIARKYGYDLAYSGRQRKYFLTPFLNFPCDSVGVTTEFQSYKVNYSFNPNF
jgi:hypothetical protein